MRYLLVALIALAGCRLDDIHYVQPDGDGSTLDGGIDAVDAPPGTGALIVTPTALVVREGDTTTAGVRLSSAPTGSLIVTFSAGGAGSGLAFTPASLTFTPGNWSAAQAIFVDALDDDDAADSQKVIAFSATGYDGATVAISITDNDVLGLFVTPPALDLTEGRTGTLQLTLTAAPATTTTVTLTSSAPGVATVSPSALTFTSGNWSTIQTATVTGVDDADVTSGMATITVAAPSMISATVEVDVTDDDVLAIVPSTTSLTVGEGQASSGVTVALTQLPPSAMTVTLTASDPAVTVTPSTLTFTTMAAQPITIRGLADVDYAGEAVTITLRGSLPGVVDRTVAVAVTDDDTQAIVAAPVALTATERGVPVTFDVHLAYQPEASATVGLATLGTARVSLDRTQVTFTAGNYAVDQRITVTPLTDNDLASNQVAVALSTADAPANATVMITIADADRQTLIATPASLNVNEGGLATFTVNLGFAPAGSATVTATAGNPQLMMAPTMLTFDAATWGTPQTVTLTAGTDVDTADLNTMVTLAGAAAPQSTVVAVHVVDQSVSEFAVTPSVRTVLEGATGTLVVTLTAQPSAPSTVTVATSDATIATATPTSFTLDAVNWNTGVTVTVAGVQDADVVDDTATITFTAGASTRSATANVTDDDQAAVVLSATALSVPEAGTAIVNVRLSAAPVANTTVSITAPPGVSLSTTALSFNSSDWNLPHPVVLTAVRDDNVNLDMSTVTFTPSPAGTAASATVTESVDYTIVTGFAVAVGDPGARAISALHAWQVPSANHDGATTLPACAEIDKMFAIGKSATAGTVQVGLYSDASGAPDVRLLDSATRALLPGLNTYTFSGLELCGGAPPAFLAVRTSGSAELGFQQRAIPIVHCTRNGGGMPTPFGSGSVSCGTDAQPVAVWFVLHAKTACSC